MNKDDWWQVSEPPFADAMSTIWIPVGSPGYAGARKFDREAYLTKRIGAGNWRTSHYVRGRIVSKNVALLEYEQSYRVYLRSHPEIVEFLVKFCGNVYDYEVQNTDDHEYEQPHTRRNHYQDISIRRVISELVDNADWPHVTESESTETDLTDLSTGEIHRAIRARGFQGDYLLQVRGPESPGFLLNPGVVPAHDPSLITSNPKVGGWFLSEGCCHLSVEAFWQLSKVVEVRYDRFLELKNERKDPLGAIE